MFFPFRRSIAGYRYPAPAGQKPCNYKAVRCHPKRPGGKVQPAVVKLLRKRVDIFRPRHNLNIAWTYQEEPIMTPGQRVHRSAPLRGCCRSSRRSGWAYCARQSPNGNRTPWRRTWTGWCCWVVFSASPRTGWPAHAAGGRCPGRAGHPAVGGGKPAPTADDGFGCGGRSRRDAGLVAFAFLCALRFAAVSTRYMLYRHMAAGEYASAPFSFRLPLLLSAALPVFLRKRRKWRQTKRRRPSGAASLYPF